MTKEEMKNEAINRLQKLDIYKPYINAFKSQAQKVCFFEGFGGFYVQGQEPELEAKMKEIEQKYNCMVYAITHENTLAGECWSFLLVTDDQDGWEYELDTYGQGFSAFAYVWNINNDMFSELGDVVVQSFGGGIRRIG